jgi:hypothetical protein
VADGLDSAGGYEYLRQPTDLVVLGKVRLTPAARDIQVRTPMGHTLGGWRASSELGRLSPVSLITLKEAGAWDWQLDAP